MQIKLSHETSQEGRPASGMRLDSIFQSFLFAWGFEGHFFPLHHTKGINSLSRLVTFAWRKQIQKCPSHCLRTHTRFFSRKKVNQIKGRVDRHTAIELYSRSIHNRWKCLDRDMPASPVAPAILFWLPHIPNSKDRRQATEDLSQLVLDSNHQVLFSIFKYYLPLETYNI